MSPVDRPDEDTIMDDGKLDDWMERFQRETAQEAAKIRLNRSKHG